MMVVGRVGCERPRRRRWVEAVAAAVVVVLASGCGKDSTTSVSVGPVAGDPTTTMSAADGSDPDAVQTGSSPSTTAAPSTIPEPTGVPAPVSAEIEWEPSGDGLATARLEVPVDYDNPTGPKISLSLVRHHATDASQRIGTLLVNPGGPGFPGTNLARNARLVFGPDVLARFDVIGWDPRGAGSSTPAIDCIDDYDRYFTAVDHTPRDEEEQQLVVDRAEEFAQGCAERSGDLLPFVGTNNSARDIDSIRRALGEDKISYYGFSYGSELGATWMTLFPDTVRVAVLDGAGDPTADYRTATEQQMKGFQASIERFFERCRSQGCAFAGDADPKQVYDELMSELDANPLSVSSGRPPVNRDVARMAVIYSMYDDDSWNHLDLSLQAARNGDGSGLLALNDNYFARARNGSYPNSLEAFQVITCADSPTRDSVAETDKFVARMAVLAPLVVPSGTIEYDCTFFDAAQDPRVEITGGGTTAPVLVIGITGDPATPLESSKKMADAISGASFLTVDADQHTGYGVNDCVVKTVNEFMINLTRPAADASC